ncbi:uncharacterized protein [Phyllobates terribilis]|uniref:uncharacterized protein isoform X2 n=2 Tax=Phyllobates terribilis TaxID=111132 RepID=UPI003CCB462A
MDYKAREVTWLSKVNGIICDEPTLVLNKGNKDTQEMIERLKGLLLKRTRIWWNRAFLGKYREKNLIPRGLRVQVFPSFEIRDECFRQKWEEAATSCSLTFLGLLSQLNSECITEMDGEIEELQKNLQETLDKEALSKLNQELETSFTKWETEIYESKTNKFQRDIRDLSQNNIYRWRRRSRGGKKTKYSDLKPRSNSIISQTSGEDQTEDEGETSGQRVLRSAVKVPKGKNNPSQSSNKNKSRMEVINLSTHVLSPAQIQVLEKGLTFSPTNTFDLFSVVKDLNLFARKLVLHKVHNRGMDSNNLEDRTPNQIEDDALMSLERLSEEQTEAECQFILMIPHVEYERQNTKETEIPYKVCMTPI